MRIRDKRSYVVCVGRNTAAPILYLLDTSGKTVRVIDVPGGGITVTVPVGMTVEYFDVSGMKPGTVKVNGAEANMVHFPEPSFSHNGYFLTTHPRVGDIVYIGN